MKPRTTDNHALNARTAVDATKDACVASIHQSCPLGVDRHTTVSLALGGDATMDPLERAIRAPLCMYLTRAQLEQLSDFLCAFLDGAPDRADASMAVALHPNGPEKLARQ